MTAAKAPAPDVTQTLALQVRVVARQVARVETWEDAQRAATALAELEVAPAVKGVPRVASAVATARIHMRRLSKFIISRQTGVRLAGEALAFAVDVLEESSCPRG